jgi:hypothetical protein
MRSTWGWKEVRLLDSGKSRRRGISFWAGYMRAVSYAADQQIDSDGYNTVVMFAPFGLFALFLHSGTEQEGDEGVTP